MLPRGPVVARCRAALRCPHDYSPPRNTSHNSSRPSRSLCDDDASFNADDPVRRRDPLALLYRVVFRLEFDYGPLLAKQVLDGA